MIFRFIANKVRPINETLGDEVQGVFKDADIDCEAELTEQDMILLKDIETVRQQADIPQEYYDYVNDSHAFSQVMKGNQIFKYHVPSFKADMCLVQGAFFGQYLLYPEHYGGKHATHEEVDNFLKLWRANGYYLGISDEYNAVLDTFEETKIFGQMTMERLLKPCMLNLSPEAIHMAKVI